MLNYLILFFAEHRFDIRAFADEYLSEDYHAHESYRAAHEDIAEEVCADDYAADCDHAGVGDGGDPADSSLALALDIENIEEHKQAVDRAGGAGVSARE